MTFEFFHAVDTGRARSNNEDSVAVDEANGLTQNQTLLIGIGAFGLVLIIAGGWLYIRDRKKEEDLDDEDSEFEDTESTMDAIIALDDLHREGKISDEAYQKRRAELKSALKKQK